MSLFAIFVPRRRKKRVMLFRYGTEPVSPSFLINALASIHVSSGGDMNTLPSSFSLCPYAGGRKEGEGSLLTHSVLSFFLFHGPLPGTKKL